MRKIIIITLSFWMFSCSIEANNFSEEKKPLKDLENELVEITRTYLNVITGIAKNFDIDSFSKYISTEYKEYICKEAKIDNFDSVMTLTFLEGKYKMDELRAKGAIISNGDIKVKEKFINGDTIVFLIQTNIIMVVDSKNKKLTSSDYILAISNNYGNDWYLFQADIPEIKKLIDYRLDDNATMVVIKLIDRHEPSSKIEKLR